MTLRWSEERLREWQMAHGKAPPPGPSEKALMAAIVRIATQHGWLTYHTFDSRKSPSGFPDLVLVKPPVCLFVECKTQDGLVRLAQQRWLEVLGQVERVEARVWRPENMADISDRLRQ